MPSLNLPSPFTSPWLPRAKSTRLTTRTWYESDRVVRKFQPFSLRSAACVTGLASVAAGSREGRGAVRGLADGKGRGWGVGVARGGREQGEEDEAAGAHRPPWGRKRVSAASRRRPPGRREEPPKRVGPSGSLRIF